MLIGAQWLCVCQDLDGLSLFEEIMSIGKIFRLFWWQHTAPLQDAVEGQPKEECLDFLTKPIITMNLEAC